MITKPSMTVLARATMLACALLFAAGFTQPAQAQLPVVVSTTINYSVTPNPPPDEARRDVLYERRSIPCMRRSIP